jgi:redox-sensing transcriptional repressor
VDALKNKIPTGVIERLPVYLNCLLQLDKNNVPTVSSKKLGELTGTNPAEIRRDLTHFGSFGVKGVGYNVKYVIQKLQQILGSDHPHRIALFGAGNLGSAIAGYNGLKKHGFYIAAVFDVDLKKIGKTLSGVPVLDLSQAKKFISDNKISMAILAVPPSAAQLVANLLVKSGIKVILNYTSEIIETPPSIQVHNSDPVNELLYTLYYLTTHQPIKLR